MIYWLSKIGVESNVHMSVYSVKNGQVGPKSFAECELMTWFFFSNQNLLDDDRSALEEDRHKNRASSIACSSDSTSIFPSSSWWELQLVANLINWLPSVNAFFSEHVVTSLWSQIWGSSLVFWMLEQVK